MCLKLNWARLSTTLFFAHAWQNQKGEPTLWRESKEKGGGGYVLLQMRETENPTE